MSKNFAVIGGDLRIIKLIQMMAEEGNKVYTYGIEKKEELKNKKNIENCINLKSAIEKSEIIIGPIPFSSNKKDINTPFSDEIISIEEIINLIDKKILIAGSIPHEVYDIKNSKNIKIIDIMKREELAILNTISTAEGTIQIMIENRKQILHGSKCLILGFGRVAKTLTEKLKGLHVDVTCAARKEKDLAWIKAYGYKETNINNIGENLKQYDIIINTVPQLILTEGKLKYVNKQCLLIDLASNPGGIDREISKRNKLNLIWALALPGKVAPITTAEFIKYTINNILKETD